VYGLATRVEKIMDSMGFVPADADLPVGSFSGTIARRISYIAHLELCPKCPE
jgi:hypothetical protein